MTVRDGDIPTSTADRAGVRVARLIELRSKLDQRTLDPGQKFKSSR